MDTKWKWLVNIEGIVDEGFVKTHDVDERSPLDPEYSGCFFIDSAGRPNVLYCN